jgi:hypothetical protein
MFEMKKFKTCLTVPKRVVDAGDEIPDSMDIFQRSEADFLPEGKTLEELTPEELRHLKMQYRYDFYRPGTYQGITGINSYKGNGSMM